jgi:hypothetical protein
MAGHDDNTDGTLFEARANDCVKDELWLDWHLDNRQGPNPDSFTPAQVDKAYADLVLRQRAAASAARKLD